jgi:hypothetical protein
MVRKQNAAVGALVIVLNFRVIAVLQKIAPAEAKTNPTFFIIA